MDFQNEYHINTSLITMDDPGDLPFSVMEVIYRLVREGLSNIYKHASATAALVSLRRTDNDLILKIQDNGVGLPEEKETDGDDLSLHFGLNLMKQMVAPLNGQFLMFNNEDQGVTLMVTIPLTLEENNHDD
jgi:signal transduction histidine kinase